MRIGIDARFYNMGSAGLARYTQELVNHLAQAKTDHTFVIFLKEEDHEAFALEQENVEVWTTSIGHYTVKEQLKFGSELKKANLDLMHFTNFNFPLTYRGPFIISINDLTLLHYSGRSRASRFKIRPMRHVMQQGANRSLEILTYSEHQKQLIVEEFKVAPDKVNVIYLAVDSQFKPLPESQIDTFRRRKELTEPFIMYTGQWREHKNLVRLIKAFGIVRADLDCKLVLVGKVDPAFPIIQKTITAEGLAEDIVLTGFVADADLPRFYNAADVFAFPSLSEGFGLPPLEAMACGTAVAASSAPPMPEILGEAAYYFDPLDVQDMARCLKELLTDPRARASRLQAGFDKVGEYSWHRTAAQTLESYDRAIKKIKK